LIFSNNTQILREPQVCVISTSVIIHLH